MFPRFAHMRAMYEVQKRAKPSLVGVEVPPTNPNLRPYRPPDYAEEWKLLRRAWSLARNGQTELSERIIAKASEELYPPEHSIDTLQNWIWRFATFLCNPGYEQLFDGCDEGDRATKKFSALVGFPSEGLCTSVRRIQI